MMISYFNGWFVYYFILRIFFQVSVQVYQLRGGCFLDPFDSVLSLPQAFWGIFRTFLDEIKKYPENMDFVEKEKYPGYHLGSGCEIVLSTRRKKSVGKF